MMASSPSLAVVLKANIGKYAGPVLEITPKQKDRFGKIPKRSSPSALKNIPSRRERQPNAPWISQEDAAVSLLAPDLQFVELGNGPVERFLVVETDLVVGKAGHVVGARAGAAAVPDIGCEMVVIAAARKEARARITRHYLQAKHVAIEGIRLRGVAGL